MNHKHRVFIPLLIVISLALAGLLVYRINRVQLNEQRSATEKTTSPEITPTPILENAPSTTYKDLIEIFSPLPNSVIVLSSPVTKVEVKGRARGMWFFEASFPMKLVNTVGDTIATGIAQADGEWMTTEYVPFTASLSFSASVEQTGKTGTLILKKDNPSGEPANDDAFLVPVQFAP